MGRALRLGAGLVLAFVVLTCTDERVAGPTRPGALQLDFSGLTAPAASGEPDIPLDSIRITFRSAGQSTIAYDTTIAPIGAQVQGDSAVLLLKVPLDHSPQDFDVTVEAFGAGILWYQLVTTLTIVEGDNPTPAPFTASYVGPGATATRVQVLPADTTAEGGTTVALHAVVYDATNTPIAGVPVGYRLSDSTKGNINVNYLTATLVGATNVRDSVWLIAETPTHLKDSTRVHIEPPAATLQKTGGDLQNGAVGVALALPLSVQVLDGLGAPYKKGRVITWSVTAGTGNLSASTTTSDSSGNASVTVTPTASGSLTIQANAAGLSGSPAIFTAATTTAPIAQVILDRTNDTIPVGNDLQYTATLKDSAGNTVGGVVAWTATAPSVATVTSSGLAHAVAGGVTSIIAAAGGHADTASLTVSGLASIVVSPADTVITSIGDTVLLGAVGLDNFGNTVPGLTIRFTSATPSVATVNAITGRVIIIGAGNAVVLAKDSVSGLQGAATLRVNQVTFAIQNTPALPDSLQVGVLGQGQIVARALDRRGFPIPGKTIGFSSRNTGIATVNTGGRVTGVALGATFVADSVDGFKDSVRVAVVTTPPPVIQWAFDSIAVGNGGNVSIALSLTRTDPSPLIVKFTSSDTLIAKTSFKTVTFPSNTANTSVVIQGVAAGRVTIVATDSSGLGYQADSIVVTVVSTIEFRDIGQFFQRTNFYVNQNETYRAQVFLSDPAPAGGLGVTFIYKTGGAVVAPAPAVIPAGQLAADVVFTGLAPGRDSVVPTSGAFVGKFSYVDVAANDLALQLPFPYTGVLGVGQSFQPYTSITYAMDHPLIVSHTLTPAIGTVRAADTIPTASSYVYTTVGATATGQTKLKVTAQGWNPDSATLSFSTPEIVTSGSTSMIAGNPSKGLWNASAADSLGYGHPVTAPLIVTATSRDSNVVAVDIAADTIPTGSSSVSISSALRAQPGAGGDSTWIVVTAPGYRADSFLVHVTPPGLSFNHSFPYDGRVGLGMRRVNAAYISIPYVRPDTFWVIFNHTHAGLIGHTNPDSVAIPAGQTTAYLDIQGDSLGIDSAAIDARGAYVVSGSPAVFTVDPIHVRPNNVATPLYTISTPRAVTAYVVDSANGYSYPLMAPLTVTLTSGNANAFTLDSGRVTIAAGASTSGVDTLRVAGVDTAGARIFSSAPGSSPDSSNLIRVLPTPLGIQVGFPYTVSRGLKLQSSYVYVTGGNAPDTTVVTLTHTNPAAASLPITTVLIPKGQSSSQVFEIWGVDSTGTDTIIATASGYVSDSTPIILTPSSLFVGNPGTSHQTTDAPSLVSVTTGTRSGYGLKPSVAVTYTIASTDASVIAIDSAGTVTPAEDSGTAVIDTASATRYFKIRYVGGGTARIIVSAPGFAPDTTPLITVTGPTLHLAYATITVGTGQVFQNQYVYVDNNFTGQPLIVQLTKSDSTLPPASQAFLLSTTSVVIPVGSSFSPSFDITGQTIGAAQLIARATGYTQSTSNISVGQPKLVANVSNLSLPIGGVASTVFVTATDQNGNARVVADSLTVSQVSSVPAVVQGDSASRVIPTDFSQTSFRFSGLQRGTAQVVFSAPGYTSDTMAVSVDSGQLQIINAPITIGPNQVTSFQTYVQLNYTTETDVTVNLSSDNPSVLQVPASVVIPASSYYAFFDVTGVSLGTATIQATSADAKAAAPVTVRVSRPTLSISMNTTVVAGADNFMSITTVDSLGTPRVVNALVTVSLGSDNPTHTTFDSTPVSVVPGDLTAYSGVRFDTAGTYRVIAAAPGYKSDTVTVSVGGAFVIISGSLFFPDTVTIKVNNYITWYNGDPFNHTSTSDTGIWNSGNIAPGNLYQRFFNTVGTFPYHCTIHGVSMAGTVIVTP
ncbi:MAG TPA: hypothetical protein VJ816_12690 [Gemmatimonadales bacterium]|nr:hypothetical protein [Gemmatimonadales bacterium]